jgi:exosome complex component MTR3
VDLVSGGVAAVVVGPSGKKAAVQDPSPAEHQSLTACGVVGYLEARDEITELWIKGDAGEDSTQLLESAVAAASASRTVLLDAVTETAKLKFSSAFSKLKEKVPSGGDVEMAG